MRSDVNYFEQLDIHTTSKVDPLPNSLILCRIPSLLPTGFFYKQKLNIARRRMLNHSSKRSTSFKRKIGHELKTQFILCGYSSLTTETYHKLARNCKATWNRNEWGESAKRNNSSDHHTPLLRIRLDNTTVPVPIFECRL